MDEHQLREIENWLVTDGARCSEPTGLLEGYCVRLGEAGIPVDRSTLGAPLLHPVAQSSYVFWNKGESATQRWFLWTPEGLDALHASPIYPLYTEGRDVTINLADEEDRARYPIGPDLWKDGFHQYLALAIPFTDGSNKAFTAATRQEGGFDETQIAALRTTLPMLTLAYEGFITRNMAQTLMETYVGKRAGLRVLDGHIARGDGSDIEAVIWFSDLRGFTELGMRLDAGEMLNVLNNYLSVVTEAIEDHGGEVLKYIGDAVLAIFPTTDGEKAAVANAEEAARSALGKTGDAANKHDFGIALHMGRVFYGNIGGGSRLDFTVIGSAVNMASRIEGLCTQLDSNLLASRAIADLSDKPWKSAGTHSLKGISEPAEIFDLRL